MLIDTHTHLFSEQFNDDRTAIIQRAMDQGVEKFLLPNIDIDSIEKMHKLVKQFPENCYPMMGLHPCSVEKDYKTQLKVIEHNLLNKKYVAVGEIGLDYYWDTKLKNEQIVVFKQHINWAKQLNLPVAIHCRDSMHDVLDILEEMHDEYLSGVLHCFSGSREEAERAIKIGFYLGIGGVVTFKNGGLDRILPDIDLNHIVLETDSPYLAPAPYRGKRNESAYLVSIAQKVADIKQLSIDEVAKITTANAQILFNL